MPLCVQTHAEAQALYDAGYDEDIMKPSMFGTVWMAPLCRYTWLLVFHCTSLVERWAFLCVRCCRAAHVS